ncbi:hypothetical protein AAMO2058_000491100 [Amorphochlora amoebiformis]
MMTRTPMVLCGATAVLILVMLNLVLRLEMFTTWEIHRYAWSSGSTDNVVDVSIAGVPYLDISEDTPNRVDETRSKHFIEEREELAGINSGLSYWPKGEPWPGPSLGQPRRNYRIAIINVWLGKSLPKHTIQTLHTFSRNRNASTYMLFTDPQYLAGLSKLASDIPGVEVISTFELNGRKVGLKEYIHYRFWKITNKVTGIKEPFKFNLAHNLCDYRPLFGAIFHDYITEYSHWAWVDKDTFVGDLSHWISANDLLAAEVLGIGGTKHGGKVMVSTYGWLAIFQNTRRANELMLYDKDQLLKAFNTSKTHSKNTDEYGFNRLALAGPGRDKLKPPIRIIYIVYSTRKRHAALVRPPSESKHGSGRSGPYWMVETSTCFDTRIVPNKTTREVGLCRSPDDREAKFAMQMYNATFVGFEGGTVKLPADEIDCCGWWMGNNLRPEHTGFFKFYRDPDGEWWKRRALPKADVKLIQTKNHKGKVIQWKRSLHAHVRKEMCIIDRDQLDDWVPIGHECTGVK